MNRRKQRREGNGALELVEEAAHLLRVSSWRALGYYYLGGLPFVLGFLYFWVEMSRSSSAYEHCAPASFGMALLFLWMKTWQTIFAGQLKAQIAGRPASALSFSRFVRAALVQIVIQPSGLFILPLALLFTLPFGWVYAFYQSATALGAEDGAEVKRVFQRAIQQAQLWPKQNHLLLAILALFGLVVFLDVTIGFFQIPALLKTVLGVESAFTRGGWSFFNTTFLATVWGLTYLLLDPLLKAVYLLRCFYGESLQTGEDLKVELKQFVPGTRGSATVLVLLVALTSTSLLNAAGPSENPKSQIPNPKSGISPPDLDRAIEQVINQPEFNWRLPREKRFDDAGQKGIFASFMDGMLETIRAWSKTLARWVKAAVTWLADVLDWLKEKVFGKNKSFSTKGRSASSWMTSLQILIFVLLALAACATGVLFYRTWRQRRRRTEVASEAVVAVPDLADENVTASQLPEDDWLRLARELLSKGELRFALRALYLASLAHLAQRDMISLAKFKSNRDYEQELRRRARALPDLQDAFAENVGIFDRVWYGLHDVTREALQRFQINLEKIQAC